MQNQAIHKSTPQHQVTFVIATQTELLNPQDGTRAAYDFAWSSVPPSDKIDNYNSCIDSSIPDRIAKELHI